MEVIGIAGRLEVDKKNLGIGLELVRDGIYSGLRIGPNGAGWD